MRRVEIPIVTAEGGNMSNGAENLGSTARNRMARNDSGVPVPNYSDRNRPHSSPPPFVYESDEDESGRMEVFHALFGERVRTGPFGLTLFPSQPHSQMQILIIDGGTAQAVNPRLQQFVGDSPPRIMNQLQMGFPPHEEEPGLTEEEFKRAMTKLRKHVFSPTYPRKRAWKRSLFSRISASHSNHVEEEEEEDDDKGKECAICLDEFVPNKLVLLTPCNHMFHQECIERWVKAHGQCPICRLVLVERRRENAVRHNNNHHHHPNNNNNNRNATMELTALARIMEEVFGRHDVRRH
ncbi:E3 ubiquitin-protein ligase RZF1-like [Magnolia sinica]|uniref:E3 ubiquitin-protein ligase RZF1-like n=1 Tax=Magnolia sinica TaxID=86752 RepID=UPI00265B30CB|nr:E3 ubiquitin-protein ligase RZF1-like [Magnolia sinica]